MSDLPKQDLNRLRNAIHNEAGVTKEEIRQYVKDAVEHLVEKRVKQLLPDELTMNRLVDQAVKDRSLLWRKTDKVFSDNIERLVALELTKKIKLKVEVRAK